ncbi:MAG: AI-2E family transporter [Bacteriovorax sp.]|nr:AI-2E family transporter [Bacteriovorax sp.]
MKIEIPFKTYTGIFLALLISFLIIVLRFELLLLFIAIIIAMTLYSTEIFFAKKGVSAKISTPIIICLYIGVFIAIVFWIIPAVVGQMMDLMGHFTQIKSQLVTKASANVIEKNIRELMNGSPEILASAKNYLATLGKQTLGGVLDIGILFIVSLYMFLDGPRTYKWCRAHFSPSVQMRLNKTVEEIQPIMTAYVFGQVTTSTLAAVVTFITASILHIPAAMTLAFLAAIFDIIPAIGLIMLIISASMLALAVSGKAAVTITLVLVAYNLFESYILTPYIYGRRMKLSPLVVLLSLILAGTIAGVAGMVAILPIVATYSTIEKLWMHFDVNEESV